MPLATAQTAVCVSSRCLNSQRQMREWKSAKCSSPKVNLQCSSFFSRWIGKDKMRAWGWGTRYWSKFNLQCFSPISAWIGKDKWENEPEGNGIALTSICSVGLFSLLELVKRSVGESEGNAIDRRSICSVGLLPLLQLAKKIEIVNLTEMLLGKCEPTLFVCSLCLNWQRQMREWGWGQCYSPRVNLQCWSVLCAWIGKDKWEIEAEGNAIGQRSTCSIHLFSLLELAKGRVGEDERNAIALTSICCVRLSFLLELAKGRVRATALPSRQSAMFVSSLCSNWEREASIVSLSFVCRTWVVGQERLLVERCPSNRRHSSSHWHTQTLLQHSSAICCRTGKVRWFSWTSGISTERNFSSEIFVWCFCEMFISVWSL